MKKFAVILLTVILLFCACGQAEPEQTTGAVTPTGYPSDWVQQQQLMHNGKLYFYFATGFDEALPTGYELVGAVKQNDVLQPPAEELCASHVEVGQEVYASEAAPEKVYVKYDTGYAAFSLRT